MCDDLKTSLFRGFTHDCPRGGFAISYTSAGQAEMPVIAGTTVLDKQDPVPLNYSRLSGDLGIRDGQALIHVMTFRVLPLVTGKVPCST